MDEDDRFLPVRQAGDGEFVVELGVLEERLGAMAGARLDVGLLGGPLAWTPTRIEVPEAVGRLDVELVVPDTPAPGTLVLTVTDAHGEPVIDESVLRLVDQATGQLLLERPTTYLDAHDWPLRLELPAATYRLEVEGEHWIDSHHGTVLRARRHGGWEREIGIVPGQELALTARLDEPARLSLHLLGDPDEADRAAAAKAWEGAINRSDEAVEASAARVTLHLERPGRPTVRPWFQRFGMAGTSAAGRHLYASLALGVRATTQALSAGRYTLVARTAGGRERRTEVELRPGQTSEVSLSFD